MNPPTPAPPSPSPHQLLIKKKNCHHFMSAAPFSTTILKNLLFIPHLHSTMNPFTTPVSSVFCCCFLFCFVFFSLHCFSSSFLCKHDLSVVSSFPSTYHVFDFELVASDCTGLQCLTFIFEKEKKHGHGLVEDQVLVRMSQRSIPLALFLGFLVWVTSLLISLCNC